VLRPIWMNLTDHGWSALYTFLTSNINPSITNLVKRIKKFRSWEMRQKSLFFICVHCVHLPNKGGKNANAWNWEWRKLNSGFRNCVLVTEIRFPFLYFMPLPDVTSWQSVTQCVLLELIGLGRRPPSFVAVDVVLFWFTGCSLFEVTCPIRIIMAKMIICNIVPEQARLSHDGTCNLLRNECEKNCILPHLRFSHLCDDD